MTTTVKVSAHCDDDTVVRISAEDGDTADEDIILRDGEEREVYAYDDRVVTVKEVPARDFLKDGDPADFKDGDSAA